MNEDDTSVDQFVEGIGAIADLYDGFAFDQWGVLHDGQNAYPGAVECLRRLAEMGKSIVVLTNSGKRAAANARRIEAMGFNRDYYAAVVSSGEATWAALANRTDPFFAQLGRRCLLFSQGGDRSVVEGLDLDLVSTVEEADFILLGGIDESKSGKFYEHTIAYGSMRNLPLICANPDEIRITARGLMPSCGAIAHRYEALGGEKVHYVGKPYPEIYKACRAVFGVLPADRIVAIGDSLQHDIVGARAAGFATAFITEGIHKDAFADTTNVTAWQRRLVTLARGHGTMPDWVMPSVRW